MISLHAGGVVAGGPVCSSWSVISRGLAHVPIIGLQDIRTKGQTRTNIKPFRLLSCQPLLVVLGE